MLELDPKKLELPVAEVGCLYMHLCLLHDVPLLHKGAFTLCSNRHLFFDLSSYSQLVFTHALNRLFKLLGFGFLCQQNSVRPFNITH